MDAFQMLRYSAAPAVPELAKILNSTKSPEVASRAAIALGYIGQEGMPPLLNALSDPKHPHRRAVAQALGLLQTIGSAAEPAVPILLRCVTDPDTQVACKAIQSLGALRLQPETAFPAITNAFSSPDTEVRYWAVLYFRLLLLNHTEQTTPALRRLLADPDPRIRAEATNILSYIPRKLSKTTISPFE
jgi:HEAT repeat protein